MTLALKLRLKVIRKSSRVCRANHFYQNKGDCHTLMTIGQFFQPEERSRDTQKEKKNIFFHLLTKSEVLLFYTYFFFV